jgi:drug/metabolite transporter (DMT)-like permease
MRRRTYLLVIAAVLYGSTIPGGRYLLEHGLSVFDITIIPTIMLCIGSGSFILARPAYLPLRAQLGFFCIYGLIGAAAELAQFVGLLYGVPVSVAALLLYSQPLWTVVLAHWFLGEKITTVKVVSVVFCIGGATILIGGAIFSAKPLSIVGLATSSLAGAFFALWVVWSRKSGINELHAITTMFGWSGFTSGWLVVGWLLLMHLAPADVARFTVILPLSWWIDLFLFTIIAGFIPSLCFFWALQTVEAGPAGLALMLEPLSASIISVIAFEERLTRSTLVGGAMIIAANYLTGASESRSSVASQKRDQRL